MITMGEKPPSIVVIGSLNMDMVTKSSRFPIKGETIAGESFQQLPGGKGANQAVAAARLGGQVTMIGAVGRDITGTVLLENLKQENINTDYVTIEDETTGIAQITVSENDNQIIIVPGANYSLTKAHINDAREVINQADILIVQLEIPIEIIEYTIKIANKLRVPVILNPAPAVELSSEILAGVTYLTPNETELAFLAKHDKLEFGVESLLQRGVNTVVVTLGSEGVCYKKYQDEFPVRKKGFTAKVVDTTGAGDTFNGALAFKLASGSGLEEAVVFANKAASLSVMKFGAQSGMPTMDEMKVK